MKSIKFGITLFALLLLAFLCGKVTATKEPVVSTQTEIVTEILSVTYPTEEPVEPTPFPFLDYKVVLRDYSERPRCISKAQKPILELIKPYTVLTVSITAYCPCPSCCGIWSAQHESRIGTDYVQKTSSGTIPTAGRTIATDPKAIPTGSKVVIDGHTYIAEDTGGGIKGNRIDIYFDTHQEALDWGVQTKEVKVYEPD